MIKLTVVWRFFIMYSFIVNPNSRSGEGRNVWNRLRSIMESQGISYQYFLTEYVGHATVLAKKISAAGTPESPVTLVTVGGDGTIYEVLTGSAICLRSSLDLSQLGPAMISAAVWGFLLILLRRFAPSLRTNGRFPWMFL